MEQERKTKFKSYPLTFRILYYWEKCLGIFPMSISDDNKLGFSYIGLFYSCILGSVYCYVFYHACLVRLALLRLGETPIAIIVDFMRMTWLFLENSTTWFSCAFHQHRAKLIMKSLRRAENISMQLGIPENYEKYLKNFGIFMIISNIVYLISVAVSDIPWKYHGSFYIMTVWVSFNFPPVATFNILIILVSSLLLVRQKFRRLNDNILLLIEGKPRGLQGKNEKRTSELTQTERINMISQLHRELRDVISGVEGYFGLTTLLTIANFFTYQTLNVYKLYRYLKDFEGLNTIGIVFLNSTVYWLFSTIGVITVISNVSGSTVDEVLCKKNSVIPLNNLSLVIMKLHPQANNTGNVLHAVINNCKKIDDNGGTAELNVLSLDLLRNRVRITLFGLFDLDHFLIFGTIATATTYLTIMLQFCS